MSQNQLLFLQVEKKRKLLIRISRILVLLGFLAIWEITARCGLIDVFFYSCPTRVARCFLEMTKNNQLFMHIGVSLYETILSFFIIMIETALLNHLKPYAYLTYILDELRKMGAFPKEEELKKLLPWSEDLPEYCRTKLKK